MAKQINSDAVWQILDPTTLPAPIAKQYANYKAAYTEMNAERKAFEEAMTALATPPVGKRLVFGYRFGKLSIAVVDVTAAPKPAAGSLSLSQFIASQQVQGKRT